MMFKIKDIQKYLTTYITETYCSLYIISEL